jgi:putative LysE/RhtB family amino acid efflux pump
MLRGMIVGFLVAVPIGPVSLICAGHAIVGGFRTGVAAGIGAALGDAVCAAAVVAGQLPMAGGFGIGGRCLAAVALATLGVQGLRRRAGDFARPELAYGVRGAPGVAFLMTVSNPLNLLALTSGLALAQAASHWAVVGVALGSAFWWITLSALTARVHGRKHVPAHLLARINATSSLIALGGAGWIAVGLLSAAAR